MNIKYTNLINDIKDLRESLSEFSHEAGTGPEFAPFALHQATVCIMQAHLWLLDAQDQSVTKLPKKATWDG